MNLTEYIPTFTQIVGTIFTKKIPRNLRKDTDGRLVHGIEWTDIEWGKKGHITAIQPIDIKYLVSPNILPLMKEEFFALIFVTNLLSQIVHSNGIPLSNSVDKLLLFPEIIGDCPGGCDSHLHPLVFQQILFRNLEKLYLQKPEQKKIKLNIEHENALLTSSIAWCHENLAYLLSVLVAKTVTSEKIEHIKSELNSYRGNLFGTI
jgi:hypothetical protein